LDIYEVTCNYKPEFRVDAEGLGSCALNLRSGRPLDLGQWLILSGIGFANHAQEPDYRFFEARAREYRSGLWSTEFSLKDF
jgi:hypothetical protein